MPPFYKPEIIPGSLRLGETASECVADLKKGALDIYLPSFPGPCETTREDRWKQSLEASAVGSARTLKARDQ